MTDTAVEASYRVVACAGGERVRMEARPVPEPGRDELLLRLRVAGLCGTDLFKLGSGRLSPGCVLGHELVGEVVAAGDAVSGFTPGDRVAVPHHVPCGECHLCRSGADTMCPAFRENLLEPGGFSELILVRPRAVSQAARRLPEDVVDEAAVFLEPAACVLRGIRRAELSQNGVAVVLGGGSMGLLHLLLLNSAIPGVRVVVVDPVAERLQLAMSLGAVQVCPPGEEAIARVQELSGGIGADAVFDTAGGARALSAGLELSRDGGGAHIAVDCTGVPAAWEDALRSVRAGGMVNLFGDCAPGGEVRLDTYRVHYSELTVRGVYHHRPDNVRDALALLAEKSFDAGILFSDERPIEEVEQALESMALRKALKVVIRKARTSARPN